MSNWKAVVGGIVFDFEDDFGLHISGSVGCGMHPLSVFINEYATLPGGEYVGEKVNSRPFVLLGTLTGTSLPNLHAQRQALIELLDTGEPVTIRYTGTAVTKEIVAYYESGLEALIDATGAPCHWERVSIQFLADDPYWYGDDDAETLDILDFDTFRYVAARLVSTGQWDTMGPPASGGQPYWIVLGPDGKVFIGGDFLNWNGDPASDYIVVYDPSTGTYSSLGGGLNGIVRFMAWGPDGYLYACGGFTNAGGDPAADYIARIDPYAGAPAWSNVGGGPGVGVVTLLWQFAFDHDGNLFIVGDFTNWDGTGANHIAVWDGTVWDQVGGVNPSSAAYCIVVGQDNSVYVGGMFGTIGLLDVDKIAVWDGTVWDDLGGGCSGGDVYALAVSEDGYLYAGGSFDEIGNVTTNFIARWNGSFWEELAEGATGTNIFRLAIGPDRLLYVGGNFQTIGGVATPSGMAIWNGTQWAPPDFYYTPGGGITYAIALGEPDPDNEHRYDIWIANNCNGGTCQYSGIATCTVTGTADTYPVITLQRTGGTTATLLAIANETLGVKLVFNYDLLDGEILTIDFTQGDKAITSSFFGNRISAAISNISELRLQPGANVISCFVTWTGAPVWTQKEIEWTERYKSLD